MAIRLFFSTWSITVGPDGATAVTTAVSDAMAQWPASMTPTRVVTVNYYPDTDLDGLPDQDWVLVRVETGRRGPLDPITLASIESLDALPGIRMLPRHRFKKPIGEVPAQQRQAFIDFLDARGIPMSHFAGVQTWGEVIVRLVQFGRRRVFGARIEELEEDEFA